MRLLDVNVLLAAHRDDHPDFKVAKPWLDTLLASGTRFGVPWVVWWSFLRLATDRRVFPVPTPMPHALEFIAAVRAQPGHLPAEPGERHLECLSAVCADGEAAGDLLPDATLAAIAMETGSEVVSFDRDFGRFVELTWHRPGAGS
jgi:toxin-antitoxin system PIN domain toxin